MSMKKRRVLEMLRFFEILFALRESVEESGFGLGHQLENN